MLIGDNICHDGEIKNRPNFNCRFGCDGDCDETCLDVMMKKILNLPFTAKCDFWNERVSFGKKSGANMCGQKVIPAANEDDDNSEGMEATLTNNIEPGLILSCQECSTFVEGPYQEAVKRQKSMENYFSSLDYVPTLEDQEAIANGLYQKKTGLWDETQDGPAEIYYNPPVDWWKVPVTSSRTMSFGCSENQITAKVPCARYFDFSKEVFEKWAR